MARGVSEPVALSQGRYGVLEALPRILDLLRDAAVSASFFVPAWVVKRYPDAVAAIVAGGHEVGCHGDVHEWVGNLDADEEERILTRSLEVLSKHAGRRPTGYRAPAWQFSPRTLALLARHGFDYSSNMMDRLVPYLHPAAGDRSIVEIPVSWLLDDAPFFLFTGQRAIQPFSPVLEGWLAELDGIAEAGGVANFTFHPQIIGRPSRLAGLRRLVERARSTRGLWLARLDAMAAHVRTVA